MQKQDKVHSHGYLHVLAFESSFTDSSDATLRKTASYALETQL